MNLLRRERPPAAGIFRGLFRGRIVVLSPVGALTCRMTRFAPGLFERRMTRRLREEGT